MVVNSGRYRRVSHWSSLIRIVPGAVASFVASADLPAAILPHVRNSVACTLDMTPFRRPVDRRPPPPGTAVRKTSLQLEGRDAPVGDPSSSPWGSASANSLRYNEATFFFFEMSSSSTCRAGARAVAD